MADDPNNFLAQVFSAPFGDLIASVGTAVADAQAALDRAMIENTLTIYESHGDPGLELLRSTNYTPTAYVLKNIRGELKMSLSMHGTETKSTPTHLLSQMYATPHNPTIQNTYNYTGESAAKISFEIVPVPPNESVRRLPDLVGKSLVEAEEILAMLGLEFELGYPENAPDSIPNENLIVKTTNPVAGIISSESEILIELELK